MAEFAASDAGTETIVADTDGIVLESIRKIVLSFGHGADEDAYTFGRRQIRDIVLDTDNLGIEAKRHFPAIIR